MAKLSKLSKSMFQFLFILQKSKTDYGHKTIIVGLRDKNNPYCTFRITSRNNPKLSKKCSKRVIFFRNAKIDQYSAKISKLTEKCYINIIPKLTEKYQCFGSLIFWTDPDLDPNQKRIRRKEKDVLFVPIFFTFRLIVLNVQKICIFCFKNCFESSKKKT